MEIKNRKFSLVGILCIGILATLSLVLILEHSGIPQSQFKVYGAGTPDAYGNRIGSMSITGSDGTTTIAWVSYTSYASGYTLTVPANSPYYVLVYVYLNSTFASTATDVVAYTKVNLTISGVVTDFAMVTNTAQVSGPYAAGWWVIAYWYPALPGGSTWTPAAGTTYAFTISYQAYY